MNIAECAMIGITGVRDRIGGWRRMAGTPSEEIPSSAPSRPPRPGIDPAVSVRQAS